MANTYKLIEAKTLGSAVSSVTFTSIPQTYTDLNLVCTVRTTRAVIAENIFFTFNGSTSSFTGRVLFGQGNSGIDNTTTARFAGVADGDTAIGSTFSSMSIYIPNYTSSNYKSYSVDKVSEQNGTTAYAELVAGLWSNTAAITNLKFVSAGGFNMMQYSTAYLYGISNS